MVSKRRSNTIASIGTAIVLLIVFLLLWFISIHSMREPEDEGIEVAFGVTEEGGGYQSQPSEQQPAAAQTPATSAQQPSSNELMTQEDEEALALQRQREQELKERQQAEAERLQREREAHEKAESRTCEGSREPDVQAEPEEAQMPFRSSMSSRDSPSMPSKEILRLPGSLFSLSPLSLV
jgi:type IV secretory pathway VirB10-like protein